MKIVFRVILVIVVIVANRRIAKARGSERVLLWTLCSVLFPFYTLLANAAITVISAITKKKKA